MINNFRKQTIFDRRKSHKSNISNIITIEKYGVSSNIRKVKLNDNIEISLPENFISVITNENHGIYSSLDMFDIPIEHVDMNNIDIKFINLNPSVIDIDNENFKIVENSLWYNRDYDDFLIGHCMYVDIEIINGHIFNLSYSFMYESELNGLGGCDYWIYEDGEYNG